MIFQKHFLVKILLSTFLMLSFRTLTAQEDHDGFDIMLSPRITIGYTFGAGVNCGLDVNTSVYKIKGLMGGVHLSYYMVFTKSGSMHKIGGVMLSAETQYFSGKIGVGKVNLSWGMRNVNKASTYGLLIDAAAGFDEYKAPWLGFKTFIFNRSKWPYYNLPSYTSAYTYFKPQNIKIYKQPPPKIVEEDDEE